MDEQPIAAPFAYPPASIKAFADAITAAENSDPQYNNPGDLKPPGWTGPTFGPGKIAIFASPSEGLQRLYFQLQLIANNYSRVYNTDMSILQMADKWTGGDNPQGWAETVANRLGTTPDANIGALLNV